MLRNGTVAPQFSLSQSTGGAFCSSTLSGASWVVIFHRGRFCPTTDRFLASYQDFLGRMKDLGFGFVAVSSDTDEDHEALRVALRVSYPLLSDPDCEVASRYGMYIERRKSGRSFCEPGLVVVDVNGKVAYSVISSGPKGLPSPGDLAPVLIYMHSHGGMY